MRISTWSSGARFGHFEDSHDAARMPVRSTRGTTKPEPVSGCRTRDQIRHPLTGSGFVVPRVEHTGILAASWLSSKWPNRAPEDRVLMRTFVGGARDPQALGQSDAELIRASLAALRPLLGIDGEPRLTRVYRWTRGNAQHEVGHLDRMAAIDRALSRHPGLFLTGSAWRGVGIPDCVADGRKTGASAAAWLRERSSKLKT